MTIDPTSKEYQLSEAYKPDKESTWPFPANRDGWMHAHNSLRHEMSELRQAFQAMEARGKDVSDWEVRAIQTALGCHVEHVHAHHTNEDDIFVPEFKKRFKFPQKLVGDHEHLVATLSGVHQLILSLEAGDSISPALNAWTEYEKQMCAHLQEEEEVGLPLYRAYFTPKEGAAIVKKLLAKIHKIETGSFIHTMGPERARKEFMPQEGIPFFVWYLVFNPHYKYFLREFSTNVDAVKAGHPPKSPRRFGCLGW